ncbi:hypothetical protein EPO17_01330 [Patescibacteria group bacterium]|nr:MAG: hypothetical protein EPO17_01330 [Patescibacteria group bacterium]
MSVEELLRQVKRVSTCKKTGELRLAPVVKLQDGDTRKILFVDRLDVKGQEPEVHFIIRDKHMRTTGWRPLGEFMFPQD